MKNINYVINAKNKILGRLISKIVFILLGKNRLDYYPGKFFDINIKIINVSKIKLTGSKCNNKKYYKYSGYPGGLKTYFFKNIFDKKFDFIVKNAIKGMLPNNKLRKLYLKNIKVCYNEI